MDPMSDSDRSLDGYQSRQPTPVRSPVTQLQPSPPLPVSTTADSDPVAQQPSPLLTTSPVLNRRVIARRRMSQSQISVPPRGIRITSDDSSWVTDDARSSSDNDGPPTRGPPGRAGDSSRRGGPLPDISQISAPPPRGSRRILSDDSDNDGSSALAAGDSSRRAAPLPDIPSAVLTQPTTEPPWLPQTHIASQSTTLDTPIARPSKSQILGHKIRKNKPFKELMNYSATKRTRSGKPRK